jgi:hypothetical protein
MARRPPRLPALIERIASIRSVPRVHHHRREDPATMAAARPDQGEPGTFMTEVPRSAIGCAAVVRHSGLRGGPVAGPVVVVDVPEDEDRVAPTGRHDPTWSVRRSQLATTLVCAAVAAASGRATAAGAAEPTTAMTSRHPAITWRRTTYRRRRRPEGWSGTSTPLGCHRPALA